MDIGAREEVAELVYDVHAKLQGPVLEVQHLGVHAPAGAHLAAPVRTCVTKFGVRRERSQDVSRHVDLGDDRHMTGCSERDQLAKILLRVKAAVRNAVEAPLTRVPGGRLPPPRAHLDQEGVTIDRQAPALVVGEVQMEDVALVEREELDELQQEGLRHEVPAHVQVRPAPDEAWAVFDDERIEHDGCGNRCATQPGGRRRASEHRVGKELAKRLEAIEDSCRSVPGDSHPSVADLEPVATGHARAGPPTEVGAHLQEHDCAPPHPIAALLGIDDVDVPAASLFERPTEPASLGAKRPRRHDLHPVGEAHCSPCSTPHRHRRRNDLRQRCAHSTGSEGLT